LKTRPLILLVSPLDWGLGHASRMIPLIGKFLQDGHIVILAGTGRSAELLKLTFPGLKFISLPSHTIQMGSGKYSFFKLICQIPAMAFSAFREHRLLRKIVLNENVDIVVSDNRYGLYCREAWSVLITHQISPVLPQAIRWLEFPLYLIICKLIQRFDQCWVPDYPDPVDNLSGKLSHRFRAPSNARFIGILSRFSHVSTPVEWEPSLRYELAVVLSGPEPQVSLFEKQICTQLLGTKKSAILIRGIRNKPDKTDYLRNIDNFRGICQVSHLETNAFTQVLQQADWVISRSGYSSIMDYIALQISAVLVPTPGQSEQEYLAEWLSEKGWFTCVRQDHLDLSKIQESVKIKATPEKKPFSEKPDFQFIEDLYCKYHNNSC
jgi:predicted glycosyltransferase